MIDRLIKRYLCFECGTNSNIHQHHVVPKTLGGKKTIPLCGTCHGKVHNKNFGLDWKRLQMEGIQLAKMKGVYQNRKKRGSEGTLKFLEKHSEAVKYLEMGMKCVEISKLCNLSLNTLTKIKKTINKK